MSGLTVSEKSHIIRVDVFDCQVVCITSNKQFETFIKNNELVLDTDSDFNVKTFRKIWETSNGASIRLIAGGQTFFMLMLSNKNHVTAAHECVHMSGQIMEHKGVPTKLSNDETRAYLTGFLFKELCFAAKLKIVT